MKLKSWAGALLSAVAGTLITPRFGSEFLPALWPLWVLLPGVTALAINKVLSNELIGRGRPLVGTVAAAVSLAINLPLNLLQILRLGIVGDALASTITCGACSLVPLIAFSRMSGVPYHEWLMIHPSDQRYLARGVRELVARPVAQTRG